MKWTELFHTLKLQDDRAANDDIRAIAGFDLDAVIPDWQGDLLLERKPRLGQLITQALVVSRFKQSWTKAPMHTHRQPDDTTRKVFAMNEPDRHVIDPVAVRTRSGEMIDNWLTDHKKASHNTDYTDEAHRLHGKHLTSGPAMDA